MLTGLPPYFNKDNNVMYRSIIKDKLRFPDYLSPVIVDLLQRLLQKDPERRIQSVKDIKKHPWLNGVNWTLLLQKEVEPPYIPSLRETNFDPEFNNLDCDFDENDVKLRVDTERRFSYYYESTLQSKNVTENSVYRPQGPPPDIMGGGHGGESGEGK